ESLTHDVVSLEPEPQIDSEPAHGARIGGEPVGARPQHGAPTGDGHAVEEILRLKLEIGAAPFAEAEDAAERAIERERGRTGNRVPARRAPRARKGRGERRR